MRRIGMINKAYGHIIPLVMYEELQVVYPFIDIHDLTTSSRARLKVMQAARRLFQQSNGDMNTRTVDVAYVRALYDLDRQTIDTLHESMRIVFERKQAKLDAEFEEAITRWIYMSPSSVALRRQYHYNDRYRYTDEWGYDSRCQFTVRDVIGEQLRSFRNAKKSKRSAHKRRKTIHV